jgi:DNA-binding transcriptional MerR regulator
MQTRRFEDAPLSRAEFAARTHVTARTLLDWERRGYGPRPIKISQRKVFYDRQEVETFLAAAKEG